MFGRKPPKPRKLSFLHSTIKSMVQKDLENDSDEENSEIPNPITWWDLTEEQLLKIPFHLRWRYWRLSQEELEYYLKTEEEILQEEPDTKKTLTNLEEIDTISKTPINVRLLSKDRKLKLTAIALGELKEQMEQKEFEHENGMD